MMNYIKRMFNEIFHQMKLLHEENDYIIKKEDEILRLLKQHNNSDRE